MKSRITSQKTKLYMCEDKKMIVMDLKIDNFFAFKNFHMNMSYPKKIVNSYIEGEYLKDRENFRYKKVNILMGANATGKTSIGKMMMSVFNFIRKKEFATLSGKVDDKTKEAAFSMDFVGRSYKLYRLEVKKLPESDDQDTLYVSTRCVDINKNDNYETCIKRLLKIPAKFNTNFVDELEKIEHIGWMFSYPADASNGVIECPQNPKYPMILDYTLRALDPSIKKVEKLSKVKNSYVIRMESQDLIIQDGEVIKDNILSSGTKAGIDIADMVASIRAGEYGFYYCDEKFSYVHSDIEKAFLNIMISSLKPDDQLFFTTHNTDILDMPFPKHTFMFLKKDANDLQQPIRCLSAADYLKRNTDSLRNAVENDLFSISPDLEYIYQMESI